MTARPQRPRLGYRLQYWGARLLFAVFGLMPLDLASALGGALARTVGPRLTITRRAERNLRRAIPELSGAEVRATLRGMWDNLGRVVAEYPHLGDFADDPGPDRVEVVGGEHYRRLRDGGKSGIFISAHYGNWEINAATAKWNGILAFLVYRAPNNPLVDPLITGARSHVARGSIAKGGSGAREIIAAIREGTHLGILVDQKMNDGIPVPFFGRDAMTAPAAAELALRYGLPIVPVRSERLHGAHFRITIEPPLEIRPTGDRQRDVLDIMTRINAIFERWIRERPDHWFWLHRRWPD